MSNSNSIMITYKTDSRSLFKKGIFDELEDKGCKIRIKDKSIQIDYKSENRDRIELMKNVIERFIFKNKLQMYSYSIRIIS